ncbi:hypothetical protein ACH5RR_024736 [Cinchona calisaya]|uniref:Uncharacterized protein n=1 Tax=Cinchona calisaya TaxID=153742 RepID=A0ABD2Z090_9GENT
MAPKRQRTLANQVQEEEEDAYVEEENLSDDSDDDMNQPIGELQGGARRCQRQPRFNVHMPPIDNGAITAVVEMAFRQGLQSDLQSAIVLSRAKTYKDMYDVVVENEANIKRKTGEESNKKMRFLAPQGQVKQYSTTFRPDQQFKSAEFYSESAACYVLGIEDVTQDMRNIRLARLFRCVRKIGCQDGDVW